MAEEKLFDEWPERYEAWFATPIGRLVRQVEGDVVFEFLQVAPGDCLLDAGCGTAVFTTDFIRSGACVVGVDISRPMLKTAIGKTTGSPFAPVQADMRRLPFNDNCFDKSVSITAIEFIGDAGKAVDELFRVTKPGGYVVVATLNSLSPWAERRKAKSIRGQGHILENAYYRSPDDLLAFRPQSGTVRTAVHFLKDDDPKLATEIEDVGRAKRFTTGAFVAVRWQKPNPGSDSNS